MLEFINYYKQISDNLDHFREIQYVFKKANQLLKLTINPFGDQISDLNISVNDHFSSMEDDRGRINHKNHDIHVNHDNRDNCSKNSDYNERNDNTMNFKSQYQLKIKIFK